MKKSHAFLCVESLGMHQKIFTDIFGELKSPFAFPAVVLLKSLGQKSL